MCKRALKLIFWLTLSSDPKLAIELLCDSADLVIHNVGSDPVNPTCDANLSETPTSCSTSAIISAATVIFLNLSDEYLSGKGAKFGGRDLTLVKTCFWPWPLGLGVASILDFSSQYNWVGVCTGH